MSDVNIRPAVTTDIATLLEFEQGVVAAERPYNDELKTGVVHYYDVAALIASDESLVLVAEQDGRTIGTGHATIKRSLEYLFHDRHAYLGLMYVEPEYRGQGIIQRIIAALIDWSREQDVTDYYLDVYANNQSAVSAYEKYGFQQSLIEMRLHDSRD